MAALLKFLPRPTRGNSSITYNITRTSDFESPQSDSYHRCNSVVIIRNPSRIPAFLSPSPVGLTAVYTSLHPNSATKVNTIVVIAKGRGGTSPPLDSARKNMANGIETPHAGTSDLAASPAVAVAVFVYAPSSGEIANQPEPSADWGVGGGGTRG